MFSGQLRGTLDYISEIWEERCILTAPTPYGVGFLGRGLASHLVLPPKGRSQTDIQNGRTGRRSLPTAAPTPRCPATQVSERNLQAGPGVLSLGVALVLPPHCRRLILTMPPHAANARITGLGISQAAFLTPILFGSRLSLRARSSMTSLRMRRKLA